MTPESEEWEAVAAEYVLGLLTRAEAEAVERRLAVDPRLAQLVNSWSTRMTGLGDVPEPLPAGPGLWQRIERDLDTPKTARIRARPRRRWFASLEDRLWANPAFWRLCAVAGAVAALAMAIMTALTLTAGARPTVLPQAEASAPGEASTRAPAEGGP